MRRRLVQSVGVSLGVVLGGCVGGPRTGATSEELTTAVRGGEERARGLSGERNKRVRLMEEGSESTRTASTRAGSAEAAALAAAREAREATRTATASRWAAVLAGASAANAHRAANNSTTVARRAETAAENGRAAAEAAEEEARESKAKVEVAVTAAKRAQTAAEKARAAAGAAKNGVDDVGRAVETAVKLARGFARRLTRRIDQLEQVVAKGRDARKEEPPPSFGLSLFFIFCGCFAAVVVCLALIGGKPTGSSKARKAVWTGDSKEWGDWARHYSNVRMGIAALGIPAAGFQTAFAVTRGPGLELRLLAIGLALLTLLAFGLFSRQAIRCVKRQNDVYSYNSRMPRGLFCDPAFLIVGIAVLGIGVVASGVL